MIDVVLLWHMHQPRYVHPTTGRPSLPWVRLHCASGYYDMARALEKRPGARVTVNFVPSLVEQLELMLAGTRDLLEEIAEKPAADLDEGERLQVLARSFSVRHDRAVAPRRRYLELWRKRGEDGRPEVLAEHAPRFSATEIRDVECLFLLAWLGFAARQDDPEIDLLDAKGWSYSEEDKRYLLQAVRRAAGAVLPAWRALAERGQVELSASPFYHPILPLVIDSTVARRARPDDALPPRFAHPDDAAAQIVRAQELHQRTFGALPRGMWPPEGSLSPEAVELYGEHGVSWLCGDEAVLARSVSEPGAAGRAWRWDGVDLLFRNRELSDRIGFRYQDVPAAAAVADLLGGARALGQKLVGIFLDGENAWESYLKRGADFLDALYARLEQGGDVASRTVSEALSLHGPGKPLPRLHSGSWIDASFRIWIGDPVKNEAWGELARTREAVAQAGAAGGRAIPLMLAAEGSDWFWWYGEPFSSAEDPLFDELFRAHLREAWRAIGKEPPLSLDEPIGGPPRPERQATPTALIHPEIDGSGRRFYEWFGAGVHQVGRGGAMADSGHPIDRILVGFSEDALYLRIDPHRPDRDRTMRSRILLRLGERTIAIQCGEKEGGAELSALGGRAAAGEVVEIMIPQAAVGLQPREVLRIWMTFEEGGQTFARVPRDSALSVTIPWPGWEDEHWTV